MTNTSFKIFLCSLIIFIGSLGALNAQDILKSKDISTVKVDLLADADILRIKQQFSTANLTIDDVRTQLILRGMSTTEFLKLKARLENSNKKRNLTNGKYKVDDKKDDQKTKDGRKQSDRELQGEFDEEEMHDSSYLSKNEKKPVILIDPRIFGAELFNKLKLDEKKNAFEPNLKIATPVNYEIGPGEKSK